MKNGLLFSWSLVFIPSLLLPFSSDLIEFFQLFLYNKINYEETTQQLSYFI